MCFIVEKGMILRYHSFYSHTHTLTAICKDIQHSIEHLGYSHLCTNETVSQYVPIKSVGRGEIMGLSVNLYHGSHIIRCNIRKPLILSK
jgi:hypothetical protein